MQVPLRGNHMQLLTPWSKWLDKAPLEGPREGHSLALAVLTSGRPARAVQVAHRNSLFSLCSLPQLSHSAWSWVWPPPTSGPQPLELVSFPTSCSPHHSPPSLWGSTAWQRYSEGFTWDYNCSTDYIQKLKRSSEITLNSISWKDWWWRWNSNTLVTWCEELTHWKRLWCWEILKAKEKGAAEDEMVR